MQQEVTLHLFHTRAVPEWKAVTSTQKGDFMAEQKLSDEVFSCMNTQQNKSEEHVNIVSVLQVTKQSSFWAQLQTRPLQV